MRKKLELNQIEEHQALPQDVVDGYAYSSAKTGEIVIGEAPVFNNSNVTLQINESYTLPKGFYLDNNVITVPSIADAIPGTATAEDIAEGKTAWVNGQKITGTSKGGFKNLTESTATSDDILEGKTAYNSRGEKLTGKIKKCSYKSIYLYHGDNVSEITPGYAANNQFFDGAYKTIILKHMYYEHVDIDIPDISYTLKDKGPAATVDDVLKGKSFITKDSNNPPNISAFIGTLDIEKKIIDTIRQNTTLTSSDILASKSGYDKDGNVIQGTIQNVTNSSPIVLGDSNNSYTIPKGYHDGTGKVVYNPTSTITTTATANDILIGKTAFNSDGEIITGNIPEVDNSTSHDTFLPIHSDSFVQYDAGYYREPFTVKIYNDDIHSRSTDPHSVLNTATCMNEYGDIVQGEIPINNIHDEHVGVDRHRYRIPKGYHDGTGAVSLDILGSMRDKFPWIDGPDDVLVGKTYISLPDADIEEGTLQLATFNPIYEHRNVKCTEVIDNTKYDIELSDRTDGNRTIYFDPKGDNILMQYRKLGNNYPYKDGMIESDKRTTVFAIPTPAKQWAIMVEPYTGEFNKTVPKSDKSVNILSKKLSKRVGMESDDGIKQPTTYHSYYENLWFSNYLLDLKERNKDLRIDNITVEFLGDRMLTPAGENIDNFAVNTPPITKVISFPYNYDKSVDNIYTNIDHLKKCMTNTIVIFDDISYPSSQIRNRYVMYAVCGPIVDTTLTSPSDSKITYNGGNFPITFHIYDTETNNPFAERDVNFYNSKWAKGIYKIIPNNAGQLFVPFQMHFENIHVY